MSTAEDFAAWLCDTRRSVSHPASMAVQYHPSTPDELAKMLADFNTDFNGIGAPMSTTPDDGSRVYFQEGNEVAYKAVVDEWANRFGYHKATEVTVPLHRELREDFIHVAEMVIRKVPAGRERTLALGRLQEALFYANAGVAIELAPLAMDD